MIKYFGWRTLLGWLPLIWLGIFAVTIHGACAYFAWPQCIGREAPAQANMYFWLSKWIAIGLLVTALIAGLLRKLTKLGWLGFALSLFPAIYHIMIFVD